ncbi:type I-MYXAN CRISPR-associated protein Cas6/Cmx6 [Microcoleus sp. bin38.metabat.b11b12b14.051]|uniref:type I-MYXAN CRISPR-associated protein Cas6/Cmx6 n=1 Tax=Microcoleus sp. bin38.metabat.b11b12b14.051 TaxID=2742709 RepID=UPI002600C859|nr:type I-MYXAN CRISPR-associated protein Cas6/Cmx6 [Microcoleus sp. bin38.metabat.b11b12b14.051]
MSVLRVESSTDISFIVHGLELPADHGYGLFAAICELVPMLRADRTIRLLTVAGHPDKHGKITLKRDRPRDLSRMRIRVAEENAHHFFKLGGRQLSVGIHQIVLGVPTILPLKPAADLFARIVVIAGYQQPDTDCNVVMNGDLNIIEIQGTAESGSFSCPQLNQILDLAETGIQELLEAQRQALVSSH